MTFTSKQRTLMSLIVGGRYDGESHRDLDVDQLMEAAPYEASKQSFLCSVKFLEKKGAVVTRRESRRGKSRLVLRATSEAVRFLPEHHQ